MAESSIDRLAPTIRPNQVPVMYQRWSQLLFLHWEVDAASLAKLLPPGLSLDTFNGKAYVGLVPFTMSGVRPRGLPAVPWLSNFHETNVRTYVHYQGKDPGVWFFSLDAANPIAVALARIWFHLPYYYARMSLTQNSEGWITYSSRRRFDSTMVPHCKVTARPIGDVEPAVPGSLEFFLAERYVLYAIRGGHLMKGRVHHRPYPLQRATTFAWGESLLAASKIKPLNEEPLAHFASEVTVDVFGLERAD